MDKLILGCGYLGRRVARLWRAEGHRVWATTRTSAGAAELADLGLNPLVCDVLRPDTLAELPRAETVLYCVGHDRHAGAPMREVYVRGLANVLDRLRGLGFPQRFLYVSSTGVYGGTGGEWVDESSACEPLSESGRIVLDAEELLRGAAEAVVLRFGGIYGPGRLLRAEALRAGEPIGGDPDHWLNLIHVDDGALAILAAEERGRPGAPAQLERGCRNIQRWPSGSAAVYSRPYGWSVGSRRIRAPPALARSTWRSTSST